MAYDTEVGFSLSLSPGERGPLLPAAPTRNQARRLLGQAGDCHGLDGRLSASEKRHVRRGQPAWRPEQGFTGGEQGTARLPLSGPDPGTAKSPEPVGSGLMLWGHPQGPEESPIGSEVVSHYQRQGCATPGLLSPRGRAGNSAALACQAHAATCHGATGCSIPAVKREARVPKATWGDAKGRPPEQIRAPGCPMLPTN